MSEFFTPEYLLKYLYNESSDEENHIIATALKSNKELYEIYTELREGLAILNLMKYNSLAFEKEEMVL